MKLDTLLFNRFDEKLLKSKAYEQVMSRYFLGVYTVYYNSKARRANPTRGRKRKVAIYISESWHIIKEFIGATTYYLYKYFKPKWKRRKFICEECFNVFPALVKNDRQKVKCPYCEEE